MKNIWAVAATVIGFAVATSSYGEASAGPAASGVRASPETTSQESAPGPQAPVKVTDVRRYMSQFRQLLPGENAFCCQSNSGKFPMMGQDLISVEGLSQGVANARLAVFFPQVAPSHSCPQPKL
jgi:hypothetical protein